MPLAANFHDLRNETLAGVDEIFAELVRLHPLDKGAQDLTRLSHDFSAVLRTARGKQKTTNVRGGWNVELNAEKTTLNIDLNTYSGPKIKAGDKIRSLAREGEPVFEVRAIDDRNHRRLILDLNNV